MQNLIIRITQENDAPLGNPQIGCFILAENLSSDFAEEFTKQAHSLNKLVLTEGENALEKYRLYQADGLIVDTTKEQAPQKILKEIQKQAKSAIIGAICRNRRHEAMLVSECEPDFVIFRFWRAGLETNRELLQWYSDLFLIQCAAKIEEDIDYQDIPADFIIVNDHKI